MKKTMFSAGTLLLLLALTPGCASSGHSDKSRGSASAADKQDTKSSPSEETKPAKEAKIDSDKKEAAADAGAGAAISCTKGKEVRTLTKTSMEGGGCEVIYEKGGEKKSVATAKVEIEHCDKVIDKMKKRLTDSGFTCG